VPLFTAAFPIRSDLNFEKEQKQEKETKTAAFIAFAAYLSYRTWFFHLSHCQQNDNQ